MKIRVRVLIPSLCLLVSTTVFAHGGGGGGFHAGGGYRGGSVNDGYHNNGANYNRNNGWYGGRVNNNWDHNVWYDDGVGDDSANVVVGVPESGYFDPSCQTTQSCNSDGECVTQQNCD